MPDEPQISFGQALEVFQGQISVKVNGCHVAQLPPKKLSSLFWCLFLFVGLPSAGLPPPQNFVHLLKFILSACLRQASSLLKNSLVSFGVSFCYLMTLKSVSVKLWRFFKAK